MKGSAKKIFKKVKLYLRKTDRVLLYESNVKEARAYINNLVSFWAPQCGVTLKRIAIRDQKRSWGSCSSLGNLNFNYKLLFLPRCMADYVVIHELCHLKVLNHSPLFWAEVAKIFPDYEKVMLELRHLERETGLRPKQIEAYRAKHKCQWCTDRSQNT